MNSQANFRQFLLQRQTRRAFLGRSSQGLGAVALASLINPSILKLAAAAGAAQKDKWAGVINPRHFQAQAKRVIWLTMAGGASHLETFDYKPKLAEMHGQPMPDSFTKGKQIAQLQGAKLVCFGPQHKFKKFGQCGAEMCELFEHIGSGAEQIIGDCGGNACPGCGVFAINDYKIKRKLFAHCDKLLLNNRPARTADDIAD